MPRTPTPFNEKDIANAKPGTLIHVKGTPNLYMITSEVRGRHRWHFRLMHKGEIITKSLGTYPDVPLEWAINSANYARRAIKVDNRDPFEIEYDGINAATRTLRDVVTKYIENNQSSYKTAKHRRDINNLLVVHPEPLLEIPILKIKPPLIAKTLRPLFDRAPKQFHHARRKLEAVFDFAKGNQWYVADNPAQWKLLKGLFPKLPKSENAHYTAMPYEQVPGFIRTLRQRIGVAPMALEVVILTACRSGEVLGMRWSEIGYDFENENRIPKHFENRVWTIPAARMKARRQHEVPLSDRVIEILRRRWESRVDGSDLVFFTHQRSTPLDEKSMRELLRRIKIKATAHGFRSSFSDWAGEETDFADETIEFCLAHQVKDSTRRAYRRRTALEKRREIMDAWAAYCIGR